MELKGDIYGETERNQWNSEKPLKKPSLPILVDRPQEVQKLAVLDSRGVSKTFEMS